MEFGQAVSSGFSNYANFQWPVATFGVVVVDFVQLDRRSYRCHHRLCVVWRNTHVLYSLPALDCCCRALQLQSPSARYCSQRMVFASWFDPARCGIILIVWYASPGPQPNQSVPDPFTGDLPTPRK